MQAHKREHLDDIGEIVHYRYVALSTGVLRAKESAFASTG